MSTKIIKVPHKHEELIKRWAEREDIEAFNPERGVWVLDSNPTWDEDTRYRIKPEEVFYSVGQKFRIEKSYCDEICYTLIYVGKKMMVLMDMETGNRWSDAFKVDNIDKITRKEMLGISDYSPLTLIS